MSDLLSWAPAFASPLCGDSSGLTGALASGRLKSTQRLIAGSLAESGRTQLAASVLMLTAGEQSAWRPETGLALLAHERQRHQLAALQFALACAGTGGTADVAFRLYRPEWLYLDGWLIAANGDCAVQSDGTRIRISGRSFVINQNRWAPVESNAGPWTAHASGGLAPRYVTVSGLTHTVEGFPWIESEPVCSESTAAAGNDDPAAVIREAWKLILDHAPVFDLWIAATAQGCLLLESGRDGVAQSGSSFDHPGLIALSPPDCPVFCGEVLVHECSHQQLMLYSMAAPMVVSGTSEMSYSPIKRANRTTDRVLTGAHAVGNMILYYAQLEQKMELSRESRARYQRHRRWFADDYAPALHASKTLTEAGRALWQNLAETVERNWSGWRDSNPRPPAPQAGALPGCATARTF